MQKWFKTSFLTFSVVIQSSSVLAAQPIILDRLEASVNSSIVLHSDVQKFKDVVPLRSQLDPLFSGSPLAAKGASASRPEIVQFLINKQLIAQEFPKTDSDVEQRINSILSANRLDRGSLKEALAREGYKYSDYFELIRSSTESTELIEREIRPKVSITEDDIKNYFYNHYSKSSSTPKAFQLQVIAVGAKSYKNPSAANQIANQAYKSIQAGEPFEEVAKRISDDGSAPSGGDLGILTEDQMSPAFREQVKKLKIGQVSPVFASKNSDRYYILKLVDVKTSDTEHYEKIKEQIRNQLAATEYQHQINLWLERQRQSAFIHLAGESSVKEVPIKK
jgi:peptidyl-prolyl cis-trans isomerase SurA